MSTKNNVISVRFQDALAAELDARNEYRAEAVRIGLTRYYDLLERARRDLRERFGDAELAAILDANNGTLFEPWSIPMVWLNVEDSGPDGIAEKWDIDLASLVTKLTALSLAESHALVDAIERWWLNDTRGDYGTLLD